MNSPSPRCPACGAQLAPKDSVCPICFADTRDTAAAKERMHLSPDGGLQAYSEPYPPFQRGTALHLAYIPGREIVHVLEQRGDWVRVAVNGNVVGWVNGQSLLPPVHESVARYGPAEHPARLSVTTQRIKADVLVGVGAGIAVVIGSLITWTQGIAVNSYKIPVAFLFDPKTASHDPRLGYVVAAIGVLGVLASLLTRSGGWRVVIGLMAVAVAVLYCAQVSNQISDFGGDVSFTDLVGAGPWVTGIAGAVMTLSPLLRPRI